MLLCCSGGGAWDTAHTREELEPGISGLEAVWFCLLCRLWATGQTIIDAWRTFGGAALHAPAKSHGEAAEILTAYLDVPQWLQNIHCVERE